MSVKSSTTPPITSHVLRNEYDSQMNNATVSLKLLASSLNNASTNCKRLSITTVEGCGVMIAHEYFGRVDRVDLT